MVIISENQFAQIAYMPYAPIDKDYKIGNYEIWPYYKQSSERINNQIIKDHLNNHFGRYFERKYDKKRGGYDKLLEGIIIISPLNFNIGNDTFSEMQIEEIRNITHIIAFCAICENAFVTSSTDSFTLHIQNFRVGSDGIALWNKYFTKLDMVKFMKPYHLDVSLVPFKETNLCIALGKAIEHKDRTNIKRVFRTLELFFHTATRGDFVTDEHRLIFLLMCFEVILNYKDKYRFAEIIDNLQDSSSHILETREVKKRNMIVNETHTKAGWWAFDLYDMRSSIVHGNNYNWNVNKYGDIWTRIKFGGILLRKIFKKILYEESLYIHNFTDSVFEAESLDEILGEMVSTAKD